MTAVNVLRLFVCGFRNATKMSRDRTLTQKPIRHNNFGISVMKGRLS